MIVLHPMFWVASILTAAALAAIGMLLAYTLVERPPVYHRNGYFEFALPAGWRCRHEGTETTCRPSGDGPSDSLIILTAKYRNDDDNLDAYLAHLAEGRRWRDDVSGRQIAARVDSNRIRDIGHYRWVDAVHFESEVPNYYTRYLATVTTHIGVVITFSTHQRVAEQRFAEIDRCVESLRIFQSPAPGM